MDWVSWMCQNNFCKDIYYLDIITDEGKIDTNILGHRTKVDMFIAERLGKEKYSTRNELTGKGGKDLVPEQLTDEQKEKLKSLLI